jgi:ribonuclease III
MIDTAPLETALGWEFRRRDLLVLALTHPSLAHEAGVGHLQRHNQRLEFLGDAVLQLTLTSELYERFPAHGEGPLTQARAHLVNRSALARQGRRLNLGQFLLLSRGEETTGGRHRESTLADAFEAVIGAVFLDSGFEATRVLVLRLFTELLGELGELPSLENPKGELQEKLQAVSGEPPTYAEIAASGPDHNREFESAVYHNGRELGRGKGRSKKLAESAAAIAALQAMKDGPAPGPAPLVSDSEPVG